jgi:hypothetical protein
MSVECICLVLCWFTKYLTFPFVVIFVVAVCIAYVLAEVVSFIVVLCFDLISFIYFLFSLYLANLQSAHKCYE